MGTGPGRVSLSACGESDPVHIHDLNATILHCLGLNQDKLTYRLQGRDFRLTDIHGDVIKGFLA